VQQQHQSQFAPQARRAEAAASNEQSVLDKILAQPGVPHRTLYHFTGTRPDELTFMANQPILVLKRFDDGWCLGEHNDLIGMFPVKYAVIETRPRHSHTALVVSNNQSKPLLSENTTAPPNSGAPMTPIVVVPPPPRRRCARGADGAERHAGDVEHAVCAQRSARAGRAPPRERVRGGAQRNAGVD
jgi:hypothetical protein